MFVDGGYSVCPFVTYLASNLLSMNIGADSNIGRVSPSSSGGSHSVSSIAGKRSGNMSSVGDRRGNNVVISGGHGSNMAVSGHGSNMSNMVVGGGEGRGNSVGGSKRSSMGVDQSGVSFGLTLDNMLDWTILGNIFWANDTIGHSGVVVGVVVAGDSVAGNSGDNVGGNSVDKGGGNSSDKGGGNSSDKGGSNISDKGGGNISDKGGGNMAVRVGSSSISGSVRVSIAVDKSRVSLSLALAIMGVGESTHEGGGVYPTIDTIGPGVWEGTICSGVRVVSTISRDVLSISSGFRLSHSSGGKSENYEHLHGASGCW